MFEQSAALSYYDQIQIFKLGEVTIT